MSRMKAGSVMVVFWSRKPRRSSTISELWTTMLCATSATGTTRARMRIATMTRAASHARPRSRSRIVRKTGQVEKHRIPANRIAPMKGCSTRKQPITNRATGAVLAHGTTGKLNVSGEGGEDPGGGRKAHEQKFFPPLDLPGRNLRDEFHQAAGAPSGSHPQARGEGHVAQGPPRLRDDQEAEDLRGPRASPYGAAAQDPRDLRSDNDRQIQLRNGPAQERGGACLHEARQGRHRGERQARRRVLLARDWPHDRSPAPRAHQPPADVRHHGERRGRR